MYPLKQSTAITVPFFVHDVNGDAVIGLVDAGFTKRISKNGAAFTAMTVTITEMENGFYSIPLSTTHSDTLGILTFLFTHASSKQVNLQFRIHVRLPDDLAYPNVTGRGIDVDATGGVEITANQNVNVTQWNSSPVAVPTVAGVPEVDITHMEGGTQTVTDLKDFADAGYDPVTNKVQGVVLVDTLTGHTAQTGDSFARLGAPAAASVSADILAIDNFVDGLESTIGTAGAGLTDITLNAASINLFWDEAMTETTGAPAVTGSFRDAFKWMFALSRNKITQTSTTTTLRNDADAADLATSTVSDDATTYIRGEWSV